MKARTLINLLLEHDLDLDVKIVICDKSYNFPATHDSSNDVINFYFADIKSEDVEESNNTEPATHEVAGPCKMAAIPSGFEKGKWAIHKWAEDSGGEIDFCLIDTVNHYSFTYSEYYRIDDENNVDNLSYHSSFVNYTDYRCEFDFRLATDEEIKKYMPIVTDFKKIRK